MRDWQKEAYDVTLFNLFNKQSILCHINFFEFTLSIETEFWVHLEVSAQSSKYTENWVH